MFVRVENYNIEVISPWLHSDSHFSRSLYNSLNSDMLPASRPTLPSSLQASPPIPTQPSSAPSKHDDCWGTLQKIKNKISPRELAWLCPPPSVNRDLWPIGIERSWHRPRIHIVTFAMAGVPQVEQIHGGLEDKNLAKCGAFVWLINSRCAVGL